MGDYQEDRVQANMELARRMEAMMRQRTPEQSTLFLARIIANASIVLHVVPRDSAWRLKQC